MKKIISVLLAIVCLLSLGLTALAADSALANGTSASGNGTIGTKAFSTNYTPYLTNNYTEVMQDTNWWNENTITVTFSASTGPDSIYVNCYKRVKGTSTWVFHGVSNLLTLSNKSYTFNIPDNYEFQINARRFDGTNGNATINVSLLAD